MLIRQRSEEDKQWLIDLTLHGGKITRPAGSVKSTCCAFFAQLLAKTTPTIETSKHAAKFDTLTQAGRRGRPGMTIPAINP